MAFPSLACDTCDPMSGVGFVSSWTTQPGGRRGVAAVVLLAVMSCCPGALAQATDAELAVARQLFHESAVLESRGQWAEAAAKLERAIRIKDTPGLRYHLAYCFEKQDQLLRARREYARAGKMIEAGVDAPDVQALLGQARERLEAAIPTVLIEVEPRVERASLLVDGKTRERLGEAVPLDPGSYRIEVAAKGYRTWSLQLEVARADRRRFTARLEALPPPPKVADAPRPEAPPEQDAGAVRDWDGVMVASLAGGGAVAGALVFGVTSTVLSADAGARAESALAEIGEQVVEPDDQPCVNPPESTERACADLAAARGDQTLFRHAAIGGFVVAGVAAIGTAAALWWLWPGESTRDVALLASIGPHGASASVTLRF